jgi:hypothetical protein
MEKIQNTEKEEKIKISTSPEQFDEKKSSPSFSSDHLNELFGALAKAQDEMEIAKTENINPFYKSKYADFNSIVKASRKYLSKNGLSVIQMILPHEENKIYLHTRLCHLSGQWIESMMPINPPKNDIQSVGSYITYIKRYSYAAIVGVASAEDDDGEIAMKEERKEGKKLLTEKQVLELDNLLDKLPISERKNLLKWAQVEEISLITQEKFKAAKEALKAKTKRHENEEKVDNWKICKMDSSNSKAE